MKEGYRKSMFMEMISGEGNGTASGRDGLGLDIIVSPGHEQKAEAI